MRRRYLRSLGIVAVFLATLATSGPAQSTAAVSATTERIQELSYEFEEAGGPMEYQIYVPTTYDAATPSPLIVLLHGLGSRPGRVIRYEGFTDLAEERGYIVVSPMGYNSRGWVREPRDRASQYARRRGGRPGEPRRTQRNGRHERPRADARGVQRGP